MAKQRNKAEEEMFLKTLEDLLEGHPECLVMMGKTHKDQNEARRRRGCRKLNVNTEINEC